ncbi:MAG: hypothetical protein J6Z35_12395 [Lachnospiraceae bacterium]|nr:hypothetical protein [Lachnospiraceae bacterium]
MNELLNNAWSGWLDYMGAGKLAGLAFLLLLLLWLLHLGNRRQQFLCGYSLIFLAVCICPVTAGLLMLYQTKFYDYEWIWSLIPLTVLLACGGTVLLEWFWERYEKDKTGRILGISAMILLALLCGRLGNKEWIVENTAKERDGISQLLQKLEEDSTQELYLWAPQEVMEHARSLDGNVRLAYGRNMWQEYLNAFSYEEYSPEQREMYAWMVMCGRYGRLEVPMASDLELVGEGPVPGSMLDWEKCMIEAMQMGVNRILLPGNLSEEALMKLEAALQIKPEAMDGYYLLRMEK